MWSEETGDCAIVFLGTMKSLHISCRWDHFLRSEKKILENRLVGPCASFYARKETYTTGRRILTPRYGMLYFLRRSHGIFVSPGGRNNVFWSDLRLVGQSAQVQKNFDFFFSRGDGNWGRDRQRVNYPIRLKVELLTPGNAKVCAGIRSDSGANYSETTQ